MEKSDVNEGQVLQLGCQFYGLLSSTNYKFELANNAQKFPIQGTWQTQRFAYLYNIYIHISNYSASGRNCHLDY